MHTKSDLISDLLHDNDCIISSSKNRLQITCNGTVIYDQEYEVETSTSKKLQAVISAMLKKFLAAPPAVAVDIPDREQMLEDEIAKRDDVFYKLQAQHQGVLNLIRQIYSLTEDFRHDTRPQLMKKLSAIRHIAEGI